MTKRANGVNRTLVLTALAVAAAMVPVGAFLAVVGIFVLEASGGASTDTGIVIAVTAFVVTDFWGGGLVASRIHGRPRDIALAWAVARLVVLVAIALVATNLLVAVPVQLVLATCAAWAGARIGRKHAAMRRAVRAELADQR